MSDLTRERKARFEQVFADTRTDLLAYALRRTPSPEDAADVLSETFLIAWRRLDSLPPGEETRLWLFGVARNVLRRGASRNHAIEAGVERLARELRGAASTFGLAEEKRSSELWAALKALPESQREAILFTAWEGLTPREIAAVTGTPVNLVRVRLHRARARLKRELAAAPSSRVHYSATSRRIASRKRSETANDDSEAASEPRTFQPAGRS